MDDPAHCNEEVRRNLLSYMPGPAWVYLSRENMRVAVLLI